MAEVRVERATKRYGPVTALNAVSVTVADGSFYGLLGPSGSGKTTLLRVIAGFEFADEGEVFIGGEPVARVPVERREIGMVFQSYALFPNMSVAENVAFGLRVRGEAAAERDRKVAEALELVRLSGLGPRRPSQLSGGQRQRVALARALVTRPKVLLLDEPLSALDRALREEMQVELRRIQREVGITTIFVTHDQEEAMTLSDRIGILDHGKLVEEGPPQELYRAPKTRFAATFLGDANLFEGTPADHGLTLPDGALLHAAGPCAALAVRPENLTLLQPGEGPADGWNALDATLETTLFAGATQTHLLRRGKAQIRVLTKGEGPAARPGAPLRVTWPPEASIPLD